MTIQKPTFIVDKKKCLSNIERMVQKAKDANAILRPHFKTHFSAEIASWFSEFGITKCAVSSVSMAQYFVDYGWKNSTIAFPYNPLESRTISNLAKKGELNILIESQESLDLAHKSIGNPVGYFIKIDVGTHRTGIEAEKKSVIESLVATSSDKLKFKGFLAHAGHTYMMLKLEQLHSIVHKATKTLTSLKDEFGGILSYGDTPSCSIIKELSSFDELRPGNFVFYDWMQYQLGSCSIDQIGVCLACPVVAKHEDRNEIVVYGGAVHLSKDVIIEKDELGKERKCFGKMVRLTKDGWDTKILGHVDRLSQEHGIIQLPKEEIRQLKIGDIVGILPIHSCLTADLQPHYISTSGNMIRKMEK